MNFVSNMQFNWNTENPDLKTRPRPRKTTIFAPTFWTRNWIRTLQSPISKKHIPDHQKPPFLHPPLEHVIEYERSNHPFGAGNISLSSPFSQTTFRSRVFSTETGGVACGQPPGRGAGRGRAGPKKWRLVVNFSECLCTDRTACRTVFWEGRYVFWSSKDTGGSEFCMLQNSWNHPVYVHVQGIFKTRSTEIVPSPQSSPRKFCMLQNGVGALNPKKLD